MDALTLLATAGLVWSAGETVAHAGLKWLYRTRRVYYAPRRTYRLSPETRRFIEALVAADGQGEVKAFSSTLGWTARPGSRSEDGLLCFNASGARGDGEVARYPKPGVARVTTFGDCLVLGLGVAQEETWQQRISMRNSRFEVLNFGVEGYGPDQALLRWRETLDTVRGQRVVVLGVTGTNAFKTLNAFRPFYSYDHGLQLAKPRFLRREGELELQPNPLGCLGAYTELLRDPAPALERLARIDGYAGRAPAASRLDLLPSLRLLKLLWNEARRRREVLDSAGRLRPRSEAVETLLAILSLFEKEVRAVGAYPVVMLLPMRNDIVRFARTGIRPWIVVRNHLDSIGCSCVDVIDGLEATGAIRRPDTLFTGRHFSPACHAVMADQMQNLFRERVPIFQSDFERPPPMDFGADGSELMSVSLERALIQ